MLLCCVLLMFRDLFVCVVIVRVIVTVIVVMKAQCGKGRRKVILTYRITQLTMVTRLKK